MRNAINNNPKVQIGVIAALILIVAVVVVPSMMGSKGSSSSGATTNTVSAQATGPAGSVAGSVQTRTRSADDRRMTALMPSSRQDVNEGLTSRS